MTLKRPLWGLMGLTLFFGAASCASTPPKESTTAPAAFATEGQKYVALKAAHQTKLRTIAPITEKWPTFETPEGAERVAFQSGDLSLFGWFGAPTSDALGSPAPALVYIHGHFFMKPGDFERLQALRDRGFAVFTITLRGRNGNGGGHEMLFGEVDDAAAAVAALAARDDVDAKRIYTFGHSMGGGASAMLSLLPDVPVRITGSCGAIYSTDTWKNWANGRDHNLIRFDPNDAIESELRVLLPWATQLAHPHFALMGTEERTTLRNAKRVKALAGEMFAIQVVPGNHSSAIKPALEAFSDVIAKDAAKTDHAPTLTDLVQPSR